MQVSQVIIYVQKLLNNNLYKQDILCVHDIGYEPQNNLYKEVNVYKIHICVIII